MAWAPPAAAGLQVGRSGLMLGARAAGTPGMPGKGPPRACWPSSLQHALPLVLQRTSKRGQVCARVGNQLHAALLAAARQAGEGHGAAVGAGNGGGAGSDRGRVGCSWDAPPHRGGSLQDWGSGGHDDIRAMLPGASASRYRPHSAPAKLAAIYHACGSSPPSNHLRKLSALRGHAHEGQDDQKRP